MKATDIDWQSGKVIFWDLEFLDASKPLGDQLEDLKEDLALVQLQGDQLLDIGFYPEFKPDGAFAVCVVPSNDWDKPIFFERHDNIADFLSCLPRAIVAADRAAHGQTQDEDDGNQPRWWPNPNA
jgi:hypothetical protein